MMKVKGGAAVILSVLLILFSLTSCSYKDFEDNLRGAVQQELEGTGTGGAAAVDADTENIHTLGEQISSKIRLSETEYGNIEFSVQDAAMYDTLEETGIPKDERSDDIWNSYLNNNPTETGEMKFIVVHLTFKNVDIPEDYNFYISYFNVTYTKSLEDPKVKSYDPPCMELDYFSDPPPKPEGGERWADYQICNLNPGEEKTVTLIYTVRTYHVKIDDLYFLLYTGAGSDAKSEYVNLGLR